ncbi:hypothetical protein THAOC_22310, partial [Thalassiosira oceanica]
MSVWRFRIIPGGILKLERKLASPAECPPVSLRSVTRRKNMRRRERLCLQGEEDVEGSGGRAKQGRGAASFDFEFDFVGLRSGIRARARRRGGEEWRRRRPRQMTTMKTKTRRRDDNGTTTTRRRDSGAFPCQDDELGKIRLDPRLHHVPASIGLHTKSKKSGNKKGWNKKRKYSPEIEALFADSHDEEEEDEETAAMEYALGGGGNSVCMPVGRQAKMSFKQTAHR